MRTSHVAIKRMVADEKNRLTDEQLFGSPQFAAYLTDIAEGATKRYRRSSKVSTYWDTSESADIAHTDNRIIRLNAGNFLTGSFPTKSLKADSLIGIVAHVLKTKYAAGYTALSQKICRAASDYAKMVTIDGIRICPEFADEGITLINDTIAGSGILKELSRSLFRQMDIALYDSLLSGFREKLLKELQTFYEKYTVLQADFDHPEEPPRKSSFALWNMGLASAPCTGGLLGKILRKPDCFHQ